MREKETWDYFGQDNPYFGVISQEKYREQNLNEEVLTEFFKSGEDYLAKIWKEIESLIGGSFKPKRSLDLGCGVGRLTIPMASRSEEVVGLDISKKMLDHARENAGRQNVNNILFVESDEDLSRAQGGFDLVHSYIVIQHIPRKLGERLILRMLQKLNDGGVGVIHITYEIESSRFLKIYEKFPLVFKARRMIKGGDKFLMTMQEYDLNRVFAMLQENNCHNCRIKFTDHGAKGLLLSFKKAPVFFYSLWFVIFRSVLIDVKRFCEMMVISVSNHRQAFGKFTYAFIFYRADLSPGFVYKTSLAVEIYLPDAV